MGLSRRDLFKLGGVSGVGLGLSQLKVLNVFAMKPVSSDVEVYAFHTGILKTQTQRLLKDTRIGTPYNVPVPFFIIRHGTSWWAYDNGNNKECAVDPIKYWGKTLCDAYMPVMKPEEAFAVQLRKIGLRPQDLSGVIMSHGHLDHAGALADFAGTNVPIYFHKKELDFIREQIPKGRETAYIPDDFRELDRLNVKTINGVFDIFGDQSVVIFPSPGHTPGHQSVLVRTSQGQNLILAQDACYTLENMIADIPIGSYVDMAAAMVNIHHFKAMTVVGAQLVPPHDPDWWVGKPLAPQVLKFC